MLRFSDGRPMRGRWPRWVALLASVALVASACGGPESTIDASDDEASDSDESTEQTEAAADGPNGEIEAGISYSLNTGFDPMTTSGAVTVAANLHVFEGLVELDPATREPYAALATDLPEQVDDTTWRATLREGATFHDGSPVTVDDVVFSVDRVLDPANESFYTQFLTFLEGVEAVDEETVEFELSRPFSLFAERVSVVKIVPQAVVEEDPEAFDALPVGSGPFEITEAIRDDRIDFEAFEDYNGPRPPQVERLTWRLLSDASARVSALQSGRVQAIEDVPYIDVPGLEGEYDIESAQSFGLLFLMFNTDAEPFDDVRVRQALHYAIDHERIIDQAFLGEATAASSFLHEEHPDYAEAETVYEYDPERARELLDEAGVDEIDIDLVTTDTGWVTDVAPILKEGWDAIGVNTSLDIGESGGQYSDRIDTGDYQVMAAPGDPSVFGRDVDLLMRWWFDGLWPETRFNWDDSAEYAELQQLLDSAAEEDPERQRELWYEAIDLIAEEAVLYPIVHRSLPTAWDSAAIDGFSPLPTTGLSFLDVGRS